MNQLKTLVINTDVTDAYHYVTIIKDDEGNAEKDVDHEISYGLPNLLTGKHVNDDDFVRGFNRWHKNNRFVKHKNPSQQQKPQKAISKRNVIVAKGKKDEKPKSKKKEKQQAKRIQWQNKRPQWKQGIFDCSDVKASQIAALRNVRKLVDREIDRYMCKLKREILIFEEKKEERFHEERAMMAMGTPQKDFMATTFLADTGASTHRIGDDDGMYDCKEIDEPIIISDGKSMKATKIGKLRRTAYQVNGNTQDIVLEEVKYVPGLDMNLFAVLKALKQGWMITNKGITLSIAKDGMMLWFDRVMNTTNGSLVGINLLPRTGTIKKRKGEVAMQSQE